ncbi:hypothetical protein QR680_000283 [Steinernema hermaphroditum]|uniref:Transcription and mRNA export factor ENY2 n=1 Tax=Steinernema hermaphroditum TaxID=289476 RepID=A0AA39LDS4_9BILA|nr:hypothetical protein QR680_000283 [Steinernema hermaphroditum]
MSDRRRRARRTSDTGDADTHLPARRYKTSWPSPTRENVDRELAGRDAPGPSRPRELGSPGGKTPPWAKKDESFIDPWGDYPKRAKESSEKSDVPGPSSSGVKNTGSQSSRRRFKIGLSSPTRENIDRELALAGGEPPPAPPRRVLGSPGNETPPWAKKDETFIDPWGDYPARTTESAVNMDAPGPSLLSNRGSAQLSTQPFGTGWTSPTRENIDRELAGREAPVAPPRRELGSPGDETPPWAKKDETFIDPWGDYPARTRESDVMEAQSELLNDYRAQMAESVEQTDAPGPSRRKRSTPPHRTPPWAKKDEGRKDPWDDYLARTITQEAEEAEECEMEVDDVEMEQPQEEHAPIEEDVDVIGRSPEASGEQDASTPPPARQVYVEPMPTQRFLPSSHPDFVRPAWWPEEAFNNYKKLIEDFKNFNRMKKAAFAAQEEAEEDEEEGVERPESPIIIDTEDLHEDGTQYIEDFEQHKTLRERIGFIPSYDELFDILQNGGHIDQLQKEIEQILIDSGWEDMLSDLTREFVRKHGLKNVSVDDIRNELHRPAIENIPPELRASLVLYIRKRLDEIIGE